LLAGCFAPRSPVDVLVDLVAPDGTDRVDITVDMFHDENELPRGLARTIAERVHLDGENTGTVSHPVTLAPSGWVDDFGVRIEEV
jgi:hypothetical protein